MTHLSLSVLGAPQVNYQERTLKFRSRKELALLIYLVVEGGQHSREKLMALLWPASDRQRGQASLRNTLVRLRQALAAAESYLIIEPNLVGFDGSRPLELDLAAVQTALQTIPETDRPAVQADLSPLQAAVSHYRGDFLEGFSLADAPEFDDWASLQRETWHQRLERIFNRLSRLQFEAGQVDQAIETIRQWLARDSLNETAYRRLMQLHFLAGNRTAALHTFEQCTRLLAEELGVEPAPDTIALAERIRTKDFGLPILDFGLKVSESKIQNLKSKIGELPFVGRAGEHSQLVAAYQAVSRGQPRVVCVLGEAGIGKTRLAHAFLAWAAVQEADILSGRTFEAGGQWPYQPLVDAMRQRLEWENAPDDLLADIWLAELSQLLPELRDRYPDLPPSTGGDPTLARSRLFEAVAQLGQALAGRKPLILFVDDLQWADAATLEILPYLCRRWAESQTRILLLLTMRRENLATTPSLREWLAQVEREVSLTRLSLHPLTADATRQLVEVLQGSSPSTSSGTGVEGQRGRGAAEQGSSPSTSSGTGVEEQGRKGHQISPAPLPPGPPAQFARWLFSETAGQPFFMAETLKMLVEQAILPSTAQPDGRWRVDFASALPRITGRQPLPMPPNVREVILTRLGRLTEAAGALLAAGAVLGRACSFERLCRVSGIEELEGLLALDELIKSQLLLEIAEAQRPYTFTHDKIRDVVYTEAGDTRRRVYHRRAFESLQADAAPSSERSRRLAAELAHHALAARLLEPAFRYSVIAGDEAAAVYAHAEAIGHYDRALNLLKQEGLLQNPATWDRLSETWGSLSSLSGQPEKALPPMGRNGETHQTLTQLYLRLGRTLELTSHHDQALATYQEMETLAQVRGDRRMGLAALMARITPLATVTAVFDPAQAESLSEQALQLAQALGDQMAEIKILWNQLIIYRNINKSTQAIACGERALALARQLDPSTSSGHVPPTGSGQPPAVDSGQTLSTGSGQALREQMAFILHDLGYGFAFMADFKPAKAAFQEAVELWRARGNLPMLGDSLVGLCLVGVFTGEYDLAVSCFEEALQISQALNSLWGLAGSRHNIGYVYGDRGQVGEAISIMEEGVRLSEQVGFISPLIVVRADLATLYGSLGAFEHGLAAARLAVSVAETKMPLFRVYALVALARLHLAQDRLAEAEGLIDRMKKDPHQDGLGFFPAMILQVEAELALAQGDSERAGMQAEAAAAALRHLGVRPFLPAALYAQGQACLNLGQPGAARACWLAARAEAEATGSRRTLWYILAALSRLEPDPDEAERLRGQAREVIAYIAEHSPPDLRDSFLGLPSVRTIMDYTESGD